MALGVRGKHIKVAKVKKGDESLMVLEREREREQ